MFNALKETKEVLENKQRKREYVLKRPIWIVKEPNMTSSKNKYSNWNLKSQEKVNTAN